MKNLHLPEFLAETLRYHVHDFPWLEVPVELVFVIFLPGPPSIENGALGTEQFLLETQVSENFAQWNESNNIL